MSRLSAYVAGSFGLAASAVGWALLERPNFYSAAVYLSQSNACLLILSNLAVVCVLGIMYLLQQLLFGPLRAIEIEQLYERGWIAVTEWLFAMSTFRDEFGVSFLLMFAGLFAGKLWGWVAEGRIEALEQQNPGNPSLFHVRLVTSLAIYFTFAVQTLIYCIETVITEERPGVMTMFVFEFAILTISAVATSLRYLVWIYERWIRLKQKKEILALRRREASEAGRDAPLAEEDLDPHDLELPGWEAKEVWLFGLDVLSDFLKLTAYVAFFTVLTIFYGVPIYIIRDLYLTMRSFVKRVNDYIQYQNATRDMHSRYADATAEELEADNTCIVCRDEMRPWMGTNPENRNNPAYSSLERHRPKKLPCGHILHFSCLRNWLGRQQTCPICRQSVLQQQLQANNAGDRAAAPGQNLFRFRIGPLRIIAGRWNPANDVADLLQIGRRGGANARAGQNQGQQLAQQVHPQPQGMAPPNAPLAAPNTLPSSSQLPAPPADPSATGGLSQRRSPQARVEAVHTLLSAIDNIMNEDLQALGSEANRLQYEQAQILQIRSLVAELRRGRLSQRIAQPHGPWNPNNPYLTMINGQVHLVQGGTTSRVSSLPAPGSNPQLNSEPSGGNAPSSNSTTSTNTHRPVTVAAMQVRGSSGAPVVPMYPVSNIPLNTQTSHRSSSNENPSAMNIYPSFDSAVAALMRAENWPPMPSSSSQMSTTQNSQAARTDYLEPNSSPNQTPAINSNFSSPQGQPVLQIQGSLVYPDPRWQPSRSHPSDLPAGQGNVQILPPEFARTYNSDTVDGAQGSSTPERVPNNVHDRGSVGPATNDEQCEPETRMEALQPARTSAEIAAPRGPGAAETSHASMNPSVEDVPDEDID